MNTTDLGTQSLYRALLARFLFMHTPVTPATGRIDHQLQNHAAAVQAQYGISDQAFYAIADQAHAAAKAEMSK